MGGLLDSSALAGGPGGREGGGEVTVSLREWLGPLPVKYFLMHPRASSFKAQLQQRVGLV